ncbi:hypothetical protein LCGC14_1476520 [marine sediment metagenome]|uniref:Uncharacterized protein n=1 Tax=marine sediment metagenome TaxID=412755 RepID=A0A0F9JWT3_9ZZZZ
MPESQTWRGTVSEVNEWGFKFEGGDGSWINYTKPEWYKGPRPVMKGWSIEAICKPSQDGTKYFAATVTLQDSRGIEAAAAQAPAVGPGPAGPGPAGPPQAGPGPAQQPQASAPTGYAEQRDAARIAVIPEKDVLIVRQTCIKAAVEALDHGLRQDVYASMAEYLERWCLRRFGHDWFPPDDVEAGIDPEFAPGGP